MQRLNSFLGIFLIVGLLSIGTGCSSPEIKAPASPVGVWNAYSSLTTLTLKPDGSAHMSQEGVTLVGKYTLLEDNAHVKLDFEFEPGKSTVMYAVITGDTLSFVNLKGKKVRFSKSQP